MGAKLILSKTEVFRELDGKTRVYPPKLVIGDEEFKVEHISNDTGLTWYVSILIPSGDLDIIKE